jgi:hypothetical protein
MKTIARRVPAFFALAFASLASLALMPACNNVETPLSSEEESVESSELAAEPSCGGEPMCCPVTQACAFLTDDKLFAQSKYPQDFGTCYWHDNIQCPSCACPYYLKNLSQPAPHGYDGGTGCLQTKEEVIAHLRQLCSLGECGCDFVNP